LSLAISIRRADDELTILKISGKTSMRSQDIHIGCKVHVSVGDTRPLGEVDQVLADGQVAIRFFAGPGSTWVESVPLAALAPAQLVGHLSCE
jgi:hypothetical protein